MNTYTIYDPATGEITNIISFSDGLVPTDPFVVGQYGRDDYYVQDGQVVAKPPKPDMADHWQWDVATKSWTIDIDLMSANQRRRRDHLLAQIDRVNPIWYASLAVEQQVALQEYRLALLAVPQQPGFPTTTQWPTAPAWL
jgi:hypothetical protein